MAAVACLALQALALAVHPAASPRSLAPRALAPRMMAEREAFALSINLPPRGNCNLKFKPLCESSEAVVVKYGLPFGLSVENKGGMAVCTKAGTGGEQEGDILRYCTEWTMGLPGGSASPGATIGFFSGAGLAFQLGLFDVAKADKWDDVSAHRASTLPTPSFPTTLSLLILTLPRSSPAGRGRAHLEHAGAHR